MYFSENAISKFREFKALELSYDKSFKDMEQLCTFQQVRPFSALTSLRIFTIKFAGIHQLVAFSVSRTAEWPSHSTLRSYQCCERDASVLNFLRHSYTALSCFLQSNAIQRDDRLRSRNSLSKHALT